MPIQEATLIISVYNNVEALRCVLDSVKEQTVKNFEVIISEDAQHPEIKNFIDKYEFKGDLRHLSQPDVGWQKNKALNNAIRASKTDYLVFIDGDCLLHPRFMEYHLKLAAEDKILAGKRIKLDPITSQKILGGTLSPNQMNRYLSVNYSTIKKNKAKFIEEGIFINPNSLLGFIPRLRTMSQLKGCNMSFPKKAIYAINGFDEEYTRPAIGEDIDLTWRFKLAGYHLKSVRNLAVQYHLYHKENWTDQSENIKMMEQKIALELYICEKGLK